MSEGTIDDSGIALGKTFHGSDTEDDLFKYGYSKPYQLLLLNDVAGDPEVLQACQLFDTPVSVVNSLDEQQSEDVLSVYVVNSFDEVKCNGPNYRIVGRTALLEIVERWDGANGCPPFDDLSKPLYCHALSGQVICFTGFKNREELLSLKSLIQFMGGKVRKDTSSEITHLVAKVCKGDKYSYAMLFSVPVVSEAWIYSAWQNRNTIDFNATDPDFISKYKLKLFHACKICFLGYPEDEKSHMIEILKENGGEPVDVIDDSCTHVVVDNMKHNSVPAVKSNKPYVVKAEWFWLSIQYEYRKNESEFKLEDSNQLNNNLTPVSLGNSSIYISSSGRNRKRKRLKDKYALTGESSPQSAQKRRSSVSDLTRVSEGSFLDYTSTSIITEDVDRSIIDKSKTSKRYHKFMELWQTETNYVGILKTIMTLFKAELDSMVDQKDQLLNATEMKIIFGHLPPIYTTHCSMLEELNQMAANWSEDCSIGNLIQKYSEDLVKVYPPFINFFENTRDMLVKCDKTKPRFHAFLKLCQSKPECGRQSLQDLLIRPVQRLPSINLLLHDILRTTQKDSVDYGKLETAIEKIQKVMTYINEDKRRTEGQVVLFDIFNDIEKCPADLVSSHRCYINRCEVTELSDDLSGRGNPLVLFLFSDVIEVCKKRTKTFNKENSSSKHGNGKMYKHVELISLSAVLKVIDINETEECHNIFALMVKGNHEIMDSENKVYSFTVTDPSVEKANYLRTLCNQIANAVCRTNPEGYFLELEPQQLDIDSSEVTTGTLGKAFNKFASKTRKVGRALSFNKTPNKLKRAVSTMMSPFGNHNGLTPSSQLANLQLAALPPIPNYNDKESHVDTPTSAPSTRKGKSSSFNMGSLRRL